MSKYASQPEDIVKARLRKLLPQHFLFAEEIPGEGPFKKVVADFWCYPKEHLLDAGWEPAPFVIEAKGYDLQDHRKRTAIHVVHQAIVYSFSRFPNKQKAMLRPNWVLIHPPLATFLEVDPLQPVNQTFEGGLIYSLARLAALFQVGELSIDENGFEVRMHGGTYYNSRRGFNGSNRLSTERDRASR